jgi:hypothetical protein
MVKQSEARPWYKHNPPTVIVGHGLEQVGVAVGQVREHPAVAVKVAEAAAA